MGPPQTLSARRSTRIAIALAGLISLTACGGDPSESKGEKPTPLSITCTAFARSSVESSVMKRRALRLGPESTTRSVTVGAFRVRAQFAADEFEGRSLDVFAFAATGSKEPLTQEKYQFDPQEKPVNQFTGGHGFTGLMYVNHPTSDAELQLFCAVR